MSRAALRRIAALAVWSSLVVGLALAACSTLGSPGRHMQPPPATATTPPWLAPPLPEPGERAPLGATH